MIIKDFKARVLDVIQETHDVKTLKIEVPQDFDFKPGQFIMLGLVVNGQKAEQPLSIASSPTRKGCIDITKKVSESEYSAVFNAVGKGDEVNVKGPYGIFIFNENEMNSIILAGGIGVTPFRCYVQYVTDKKLPNKITMFYSNRTTEDMAFAEEFDEISRKNKNFRVINTITRPQESKKQWNGLTGRLDADVIRKNSQTDDALFYACGPPAMLDAMRSLVGSMGISKERFKIEAW